MKTQYLIKHLVVLALLSTLNPPPLAASLGTAFTYQGKLTDGGPAANGTYDFRFAICEAPSGGRPLGIATNTTVSGTNGLFTVTLDFGVGVFGGEARWLEIAVRTNGSAGSPPFPRASCSHPRPPRSTRRRRAVRRPWRPTG